MAPNHRVLIVIMTTIIALMTTISMLTYLVIDSVILKVLQTDAFSTIMTIQNILQQDTVEGQRAVRKLSAFHSLVMSVAKTFHRSISLGLLKKGRNRQERRRGNKNNDQNGGGCYIQ